MIPEISIIVPVYNAGSYLSRCLESLINQTITDIEIIVVLDCPTDGSDQITEGFAQKDARIKIIKNAENLHIGLSRNKGLEYATGKYIVFSDHDDWRDPDMLEKLFLKAEANKAEVVCGSYKAIINDKPIFVRPPYPASKDNQELKDRILSHLIGNFNRDPQWQLLTHNGSLWHYMFRHDFLSEHQIKFTDNRLLSPEDLYFLILVMLNCRSFCEVPDSYYYHNEYEGSSLYNYSYFKTQNIIRYLEALHTLLTEHGVFEKYFLDYAHSAIFFLYKSIHNEYRHKGLRATLRQIDEIKKSAVIKSIVRRLPLSGQVMKSLRIQKSLFLLLLKL